MRRVIFLDFILKLALLDIGISVVQGECQHNGRTYLKHTVWQPGPCTVCTCEDPIILCETIKCTDPLCDYNKGEYLQISADSCCPECEAKLSSCTYQQQTIPHNTEWNPEPCVSCRCDDGNVDCAKLPCPSKLCKAGEIIQNLPGECCPQCIPAGRSCTYNGVQYQDGSDWEVLPCTKCVCNDGQHSCYPVHCPLVVCAENAVLETPSGACCPVCQGLNSTCREGAHEYKTGEQWNRDPCTLCVCIGGTVVCTMKECMDHLVCNVGEERVTRNGECCPECIPTNGNCRENSVVRYIGDIWNTTSCVYCICTKGKVQCHKAVCENIVCFKEEVLVHLPGTCCPQCIIPPSCEYAGHIHPDGDRWMANDCSLCYCDSGKTECFTQHCPPCPSGQREIAVPGECCGTCKKEECSPECTSCQPSAPDNCTVCTNTKLFVQDGRCLHTCRMGFYPNPSRVCSPCHKTCYTCVEGTQYHCEICQPGLMWKHGQCVTQCGLGYYLQNGRCLECAVSCKSCNGPRLDQCVSCTNPAQVILRGECLDSCPENFYVRSGKCIACHPTCKTCTPDGSSCASCWQGGYLHLGQCVTQCSVSYYGNLEGSCSGCHPACEACDGGQNKNCTSCFPGSRISKRGKCRSLCEDGHYLSVDGTCRACETGCSDCHEAWMGGGSICSDCIDKDQVPTGSGCAQKCRAGQYQEFKVCKACGENCLSCTSLTACTKCSKDTLLYQGFCVEQCGQGQFEDGQTMSCKACGTDCLRCYGYEDCSVCNSKTFLKNGHCVAQCGVGFLPNLETRDCQRNTEAPVFKVLQHVQVEEGDITPLYMRMFYIADQDTTLEHLFITIVTSPSNGDLVKVTEGKDEVVRTGMNVSVADLMNGKLRFHHCTGKTFKGRATLQVTDTQLVSHPEDIFFQAILPSAITIATRSHLIASKWETTSVQSDNLDIESVEDAENVKVTAIKGPKEGLLYNSELEIPVRTFTLAALRSGIIGYRHNPKGQIGPDNVLLQASDGFHLITFLLNIEVREKEDVGPVLMHNKVGHVVLGDMLQISPDLLLAKVMTPDGTKGEEVVYTLVPPLNNPQDGEIMMIVPVPPGGVGHGWEDLGDGNMAARMTRFLQRDIDEGRIWYKNKGSAEFTDIIRFEVADVDSASSVLTDQTFKITVREKKNPSPSTYPTLRSGVRLCIRVLENMLVPITTTSLSFTDRDTGPARIQFRVTHPLGLHDGQIEHVERPAQAVTTFTQEDVNSNRIIYRPPQMEFGYKEREAFFYFTVSDEQVGVPIQEHKFSIILVPVNDKSPRFVSPVPILHVSQGGSIHIGQSVLGVVDEDTPLYNLTLTLTQEPHNGKLEKLENGRKLTVRQGNTFTYAEIQQNYFQYQHDGSNGHYDTLQVSVSDGLHTSSTSIDITVVKVDQSAPYMLQSATCRLVVREGTSEVIGRDILAFADSNGQDYNINVMLTRATTHGKLLLSNQQVMLRASFTQADINSKRLSFLADSEIGKEAVTELLIFNVSDASRNVLPSQTLTVLIQPDNNLPPAVKGMNSLQVTEGGKVTLTSDNLEISDPDTEFADLVVVIDTQPEFGFVKNIAPVEGSEITDNILATSFPVTDLLNNYIIYIQSDHQGKEPVQDSFLFHVDDGKNRSPSQKVDIFIQLLNDESPRVVTEQIFVQEDQSVVVTNTSVYITDLDTPNDKIIIKLLAEPEHGSLKKKNSKSHPIDDAAVLKKDANFTYMDILDALIVYVHNGSDVTVDSFSLMVTDSIFSDTQRVPVIIGLVNEEAPRVIINKGLRVHAGTTTVIGSTDLKSTDVDSDDRYLFYTITRDTRIGALYLEAMGRQLPVTSQGPVKTFTQADIDNGLLTYHHIRGETTGNVLFQFTVSDQEGNNLIDQEFFITILDDRVAPRALANKELMVMEGGRVTITTKYLSFTDDDSEPDTLLYIVIEAPKLGHFELTKTPGVPVLEFTQSDIVGSLVQYVHTSLTEEHHDAVTFSVTDGTNEAISMFVIQISPVDDSIPIVTNRVLRAQEGVRKLITEFDLMAFDADTREGFLVFTITKPPQHGNIEHLDDSEWTPVSVFSMTEIYENRVSYQHDGGETTKDSFLFILSDGSNDRFTVIPGDGRGQYTVPQSQPQEYIIEIIPVDDDSPILAMNRGLQFLEVTGSGAGNIITTNELQVTDKDTSADKLKFVVRSAARFGRLEKTSNPGIETLSFTQAEIDSSLIRYILTTQTFEAFEDSLMFDIYDSRPNRVPDNKFYVTWSTVEFENVLINVTERDGVVHIPIRRRGNLKHYSIVTCRTIPGTATTSEQGTRPGQQDFMQHVGQVQFDEWQDLKTCTIIINNDSIFEGRETFYVELLQPTFTLLGTRQKATVIIEDLEDEPVLQFQKAEYHVNESDKYLSAAIVRTGDISSTVSTICFTTSLTARGSPLDRLDTASDYSSRGNSNSFRVVFPSGVPMATCDVLIIDDSLNEASEQFGLELTLPSYGAKLGPLSQALVIIDGPNDESRIHFSQSSYTFSEDSGTVDVEIIREGTDLSHTSTVWCATRLSNPPSAVSAFDYIPSSSQITFGPGQTSQRCQLTIMDDDLDPQMEGDETFSVFLSSARSSTLVQPYFASVHIVDFGLDVPTMSFQEVSYVVSESQKKLNVLIERSGDTRFQSSVICYTQQDTALVLVDFVEKPLAEESRIVFEPGEKTKNCSVDLVDDNVYENVESFSLKLVRPLGTDLIAARIGDISFTQINITNKDDAPRIQFEKSAYSVPEPSAKDQIAVVTVKVVRLGDVSKAANVRCSTKDGSAFSGTDYNPKSQILQFAEGVRSIDFVLDILYNSDIEWHEMFSVVLGPGEPVGAELGSIAIATITILDNDVSGSMVLPGPPVIVSLLKYDDAVSGMKVDPSPGYPLVCITPCDSHHPTYRLTHSLCEAAKINQSAMYYRWEVAVPDMLGIRTPFLEISYNTVFTSVNHMVLDSIYFRPSFQIRCVAQPLDERGNPGIPLKSNPVNIGRDNGICKAPVFAGLPYSYQAQSFHAKLEYVSTDDKLHPNSIHISVKVPHQDGMLPLISTSPISNLKYVLSEPVYRQQHICSNMITENERSPLLRAGFLDDASYPSSLSLGFDFPYQFDATKRENKTLMFYKYLDLKKCVWTFEAWYHMTDLVDLCGGRAVSDFQVRDGGQTYLSVRLPLYVSYLYAVAPIGWGSLEHRTEMEFSFYYNTVLWRSGLETEGDLGGRMQVMRILIDDNGRLVVDFRTQANFRGLYVLNHHTLPSYVSRFVSVDEDMKFDLDLIWGQNTFDGPHQLWRATSEFSHKDYTGEYMVELIPCTVQSAQGYTIHSPPPCRAHKPLRFDVPIAFQQTNRPVPLQYTLNTHFQVTNNEQVFLRNPFTDGFSMDDTDADTHITFSQGEKVYGRVLWSPEQDLKNAYSLLLEKVFICAGRDGHVPTYDPTGTVYNNGPQFGCVRPGPNLKYRFLILDRSAPDMTNKAFQGVPFDAQFVSENQLYSSLLSIHGVDGFVISVDPLYKVTTGLQWYLQVIYSIGPSDLRLFRRRRSSLLPVNDNKHSITDESYMKYDWLENNSSKNGTNIKVLHLNNTQVLASKNAGHSANLTLILLPVILTVIVVTVIIIFVFLIRRKKRRKKHKSVPDEKRNNLEIAQQNSVIYRGDQKFSVRAGSSLELKQSIVYKGERGKTAVRVKDTNVQKDKNISKGNGTEV